MNMIKRLVKIKELPSGDAIVLFVERQKYSRHSPAGFSRPNAIQKCKDWIAKHPELTLIEKTSN